MATQREQKDRYYQESGGTMMNLVRYADEGFKPPGYLDSTTGNVITSADLSTPESTIQLPPTPQEPNYQSIVQAIPQIDLSSFQAPTQATQNQDDISKMILDIQNKLGGRQGAQATAEQTAGVPQLRTQLTDITNQLQALQKEQAAIPLQLQEQATGRGITEGGLAPIQAAELRKNAIKALGLSAIGQTLQGNLALATEQANRAVDLEFAPEEAKLEFLKVAYQMNKDVLEREDKKRSDVLSIQLAERERILNELKDNKRQVLDISMQAAQGGAGNDILNKIRNAQSPQEAISIGGFYLGSEFRENVRRQKFQEDLQKSQFALSVEKFNEDIKQFGMTYALKQQEMEIQQLKENAKNDPEGAKVLKQNALTSAQELLTKLKNREGTGAVGKSRILGFQLLPGTQAKNFEVQFKNLKSILSLEGVKYLRGQGQITEGERAILSEAVAKLELSQTEGEFQSSLENVILNLGGTPWLTDISNIFQQTLMSQSTSPFYNEESGYILPP